MLQFPIHTEAYRREKIPCSIDIWHIQRIDTEGDEWTFPRRMLGHAVLLYAESGALSLSLGDASFTLDKGTLLCAAAGQRLSLAPKTGGRVCFYLLEFDCSDLSLFTARQRVCTAPLPVSLRNAFSELYRAAHAALGSVLIGDCYLLLLLQAVRESQHAPPRGQRLYDEVCTYILAHAKEDPSAEQIAAALGYNKDHLCRTVRKCSGRTLKELIVEERLNIAKGLLSSTDYPVERIAAHLHFSGANSFLKFFKYHLSVTPAEYRRRK